MKIEIKRMERAAFSMGDSEIVATFDAIAGDFHVRRATLRQNYSDGTFFIGTGGGQKQRAGITLPRHCETRAAILEAAQKEFQWLKPH